MATSSNATPYFDSRLEISADKIPALNLTDCRHHVAAVVNMSWPFRPDERTTKYSFTAASQQQFEVDFTGNVQLKLNDRVLICLKGARLASRAKGKQRLPFKLEFPDGFMAYVDDRVINTFPVPAEEESTVNLPSWFDSQRAPSSSPSSPRSPTRSETPSSPSVDHSILLQKSESQEGALQGNYTASGEVSHAPIHSLGAPLAESTLAPGLDTLPQPRVFHKRSPSNFGETGPSVEQKPNTSTVVGPRIELAQTTVPHEASKNEPDIQRPRKRRRGKARKSHAEPARNPALDMKPGFSSALYGPFVSLQDTMNRVGLKVNAVGVVRGISIPKLSKNGDWSVSMELLDPSVTDDTAFVVNIFLPEHLKDCVPNVKAGDIIMLVKTTVALFQGKVRGTGYKDAFQWAGYSITQNAHFHSATRTFSDEEHCPFLKPTAEELEYASQLAAWWKATQDLSRSRPGNAPTLMTAPRGRSLIALSEAKVDVFFDCVVEILFIVPPRDQAAEIFVTDYTVHPQFYPRQPREDPTTTKQEQIKVYGRRVLKVMLWGHTQLEHARELELGYYHIDNLRVKFDSKGTLEGTLQDDRRKITKVRKDDPLLEDLLKRKNDYFNRPPSPDPNISRAGLAKGQDPNLHTAGDLLPPPLIPALPAPQQAQTNKPPITRLFFQNIVQTPLQEVLGHASCPEVFRIRARVAAFEPYKLQKFAHGFCTKCNNDFIPGTKACVGCEDFEAAFVAYEYRFRLCVEEEAIRPSQDGYRASLVLDVFGKDAEMFLSGVPAQDFHNINNLRKLRDKLAPIFGNLEAHQCDLAVGDSTKARAHGQYFEMLVQSYRSPHKSEGSLDNKRYRLWGTELLSKPSK